MKRIILLIQLVIAITLNVYAGTVPPDSTIYAGLTGKQLIDSLRARYRPSRTLPYAGTPDARDTLFGEIDLTANDSITCVYSSYTIYMQPGQDPDDWAYSHDFNTEHSWPQSYLTSQSPDPTGDMNHLFPSDIEVNSSRGNYPFAEIPDAQTDTWYYNNTSSSSIPGSNIDLYAEYLSGTSFEPREQQKGNTARAMYYMLTMYQLSDTTLAWWTGQKDILYSWHCNDPADLIEIARTKKIAPHQSGKINPFILDSTLIRRAYFPYLATNTSVSFSPISVSKAESAGSCSLKVAISSPSGTVATTVQVVLTGGTGTAADVNNYTTQTLTFPAGSSAVQSAVLTITDDALEEGTETLIFTLRNASGGTSAKVGSDSVFTLSITDNDDATAPVITSGPSVTGIGSTSATVVWTTNELSNSWVYYGLNTAYSDTMRNESDVASHSVGLSGLTASTTYHYKVSSTDPMNNGPTYSGDNTFTTAAPSGGSAFFYEPFDYPAGDSINGIHNWTLHSGTTNPIRVVSPGLSYGTYKSKATGNACSLFVTGEDVNRTFAAQSAGKVYSSFLVRVDSATATGDYFFHLSASTLNTSFFVGRVYARKDASNNLQFGLAKASEGATYSSNTYAFKNTYLLVLKYKIGSGASDDTVSLFVIDGTVPGSEPVTPTIGPLAPVNSDPASIGTAALRQGGSTTGPVLKLDEIKIDTSWSNSPLAVDLSYFTALGETGQITIKWSTAGENNAGHWDVWKATKPSGDYRWMTSLPAAGNSNEPKDYFWIDRNVQTYKTYYYRLVQTDESSDSLVYGPVSAEALLTSVKPVSPISVNCEPNPFRNAVNISFETTSPQAVKLEIFSITGQLIKSFLQSKANIGINNFQWDGKGNNGEPCPQGIYFFRLSQNNSNCKGKIVLIR